VLMSISFESETHYIYDPQFSSDEEAGRKQSRTLSMASEKSLISSENSRLSI
jgi:hypothetical protein